MIASTRKKYLVDHKEMKSADYVKRFDTTIRHPVDEKDDAELDEEVKLELYPLISSYRRDIFSNGTLDVALLMSPQMSSVMATSEFLCADVTFPEVTHYKYLLNITCYNFLLQKWQVTARVMMNRLTAMAYEKSFELAFKCCTDSDPEFENGKNIVGFVVDFSDAQAKGFESVVGESKAIEVLRGCRVHWMRQAMKQADKMSNNEVEKKLFIKVCTHVPDVDEDHELSILLDVLSGQKSPACLEPLLNIEVTPEESAVKNIHWSRCKNWIKWWKRPRHARMFTKSMKEMTNAEW